MKTGRSSQIHVPSRAMEARGVWALLFFGVSACGGTPPAKEATASTKPAASVEGAAQGAKVHPCGDKDKVHAHELDAHTAGVTEAFIPCGNSGSRDFSGTVHVESTPQGIHIHIEATDEDVNLGENGSSIKTRDAVVVYPKGKGSKAVEVPLVKTPHGYMGDKVIPYDEVDKLTDEGTKIDVAIFDHDKEHKGDAEEMHVAVAISTGKSCEKAIDENPQTMNMAGGAKGRDLTDAELGAPMRTSSFFSHCNLKDSENAEICVAVKGGKPLGVSVSVSPTNKAAAACIDRATRKLHFPVGNGLDVVHQSF